MLAYGVGAVLIVLGFVLGGLGFLVSLLEENCEYGCRGGDDGRLLLVGALAAWVLGIGSIAVESTRREQRERPAPPRVG